MKIRKKYMLPLITLIVGTFIGSGSMWQLKHAQIERETLELERMTKTVELRKLVSEKLLEVIALIKSSDLKKPEIPQKY